MVSLLHEKLGVVVPSEAILAAHRVPRQKEGPSPIIVRFQMREQKINVIRNRKKLKGSGITIHEDICRDLVLLMNRLEKTKDVKSTWFWNDKVFVELEDGTKRRVQYGEVSDDL